MECGRLTSGLKWLAITQVNTLTAQNSEDNQVHDNYTVTYPDSESETVNDIKNLYNEFELLNRCYENPLFIPAREVVKEEISVDRVSEELMKSEAKNFEDYKFCEAVNDFDIELEAGEMVPIVYLSTSRAARLQRALRLGGYKKVGFTLLLLSPLLLYVKRF